MKEIFKVIFFVILTLIISIYLGIVFLIPQVINNKAVISYVEKLLARKTGIITDVQGLNLKISPQFILLLNIDSANAKNMDTVAFNIKNLSFKYEILKKDLLLLTAENIYVNADELKQFKNSKKKKKISNFDLKKLPNIHVQNFDFKSNELNIHGGNIKSENEFLYLKALINAPYLKDTLKLGYSGSFQLIDNNLRANDFEIKLGNSNLYLNGNLLNKEKNFDFTLNGDKLPVSELMPALLHFQKSKDSSKKFIENFKNFKGTAKIDLKFNKEGIFGKCVVYNLFANAVWFDIPLYAEEVVFNFKGKTVDSVAQGVIGNEKVVHTLNVTKMGTPEKAVVGTLKSTLTKKFNSVPNLTVLNSVNFNLVYKIKNRKPDVYYNIDIPKNSDLIYNSFYLGLRDYKRKIYANTFKDNNNLQLKEYKYSYSDSNKENVILFGNGLFMKNIDKSNPDKFIPQFVTCHTNGYAPISVTGSFGEKVMGGEFRGDLKYDFKNNQVLGTFDIIKARHKAFSVDSAHIVAIDGILNITSSGLYKGEKYSAELKAKNNISGDTLVYNMKLFLDKLIIETTPHKKKRNNKINSKKITQKVKDIALTIDNWEIVINEIKRDKFVLHNVKLIGGMKNNVFNFIMKELNFADGTIYANGIYDFNKNTSKMTFEANNIDSNKVADMTLNLQNQIEGIAKARVELDAKDMFRFFDTHCIFEVKEGFLPRLGDKEFAIKNSKYKLSDITNVDLSQKDLMKDDIKGSFDVYNTKIKNINITTWHELSAMLLEGDYDIEKQYADLQLFWHYSKEAPKGVRIFRIPLGLILKVVFRPEHSKELYMTKMLQIPKIKDNDENSNYYRIHLKGDINNNKTTLQMHEIR